MSHGFKAPSRQRHDGRHPCCSLAVASPGSACGGGGRGLRPAHSGGAADTIEDGGFKPLNWCVNGDSMVISYDLMRVERDLAVVYCDVMGVEWGFSGM